MRDRIHPDIHRMDGGFRIEHLRQQYTEIFHRVREGFDGHHGQDSFRERMEAEGVKTSTLRKMFDGYRELRDREEILGPAEGLVGGRGAHTDNEVAEFEPREFAAEYIGLADFRICDAQRSLVNVKMLASLCRALVHAAYKDFDRTISTKDLSVEFLNDSLWKASRFDFNCIVYDEVSNQNITMKNLIEKMYNYCSESLKLFDDKDILETINFIINEGTEGDKQMNIYKKDGFDKLKLYLMSNVDYLEKE